MPNRTKILIVDDSKLLRTAVRRELGPDYDYREAQDGSEALKLIREGFHPDLITLDVEMPGLDGFQTCERLYSKDYSRYFSGRHEARVPVVFLTSRDSLTERRRGFELGAIDFVSKKFEPGTLATLVDQILHPGDRLKGVQVLLADDSPMIRKIVSTALREVGVKVIEAVDGLEAFTILCNRMSSIDLVITDIEMPVMSGTELSQRIRHEIGLTDLPVIFFTGASQAMRIEAFKAGATDCLVKPLIKEEMISRLNVHFEKALLNARLRRAVADLRSHLQGQRDMLATLSHDMRSPLTGIMGFADLLGMGPNRSASEIENIELIKQSGQLLLSLVGDILALSKQQSGQAEFEMLPIELGPLLSRSATMFQAIAVRKKQTIVYEARAGGMTIAGHAESLSRVFNNLISNALKFTREGGSVRVALEPGAPGFVSIVVADTGIGIAPEKIPYLFDRFSRTSQAGTAGEAGTGLGMSIVREFVEAHKGEVRVTSDLGRGTQFRLSFPLVETVPPAAAGEAEPADSRSRHAQLCRQVRGRRVLVVDDNPVNHMIAKAVLTNAGCAVQAVAGGQAALDLLMVVPLAYDVVLMDMQMPEMDGPEATREIRAAGLTTLPVIALTGNADESDRQLCFAAGMNDFLTKPFTPRALLEAIVRNGVAATAAAPMRSDPPARARLETVELSA